MELTKGDQIFLFRERYFDEEEEMLEDAEVSQNEPKTKYSEKEYDPDLLPETTLNRAKAKEVKK